MNDVVSFATARRLAAIDIRIGLLRLTDSAPVVIAQELGFFADEGVEVRLMVEPSWANIADKLAFGFLDAAVIVPPLAFAIDLGLRGAAQAMLIPYGISIGGNTVTLGLGLAQEVEDVVGRTRLPIVAALASCLRGRVTTFAIVHAYSSHNLLLRYWLATAGIEAGSAVRLTVVPPARAVEALGTGQIAGFCAGAPWGEIARRAGIGTTIATSHDIWHNAPEKALAVRARWAEERPEALAGVMRALLRAAKFCDDPQNAAYIAAALARRDYLGVDRDAILATLPGGTTPDRACTFYRGAATFPWRSQALWFLGQMRRWGLVEPSVDLEGLAARVYRPDLYRIALGPLREPIPAVDHKREGAHDEPWTLDGAQGAIVMPPDRFCDGAMFDPDAPAPPVQPVEGALHNL